MRLSKREFIGNRNDIKLRRIAQRYAAGCPGRKKQIIVQEGSEPISFRGFFQAWQEDYDPNAKFDSMQQENNWTETNTSPTTV